MKLEYEVADHLGTLPTEFKPYFPDMLSYLILFHVVIEPEDDELQDEMALPATQTVMTYLNMCLLLNSGPKRPYYIHK